MSDLQTRYTELQSAGRLPVYCYKHAPVNQSKADNVQIRLGLQPSGRYLSMVDLDSHTAGQDADAAWTAFAIAEPEIARKLPRIPTRRGMHLFFESYKRLATGKLYDGQQHIGELLGDSSHTTDPGDVAIPILSTSEIERLCAFWAIQGGDSSGERWSDRANQGARWAAGYQRIRVTQAQLRTFLQNDCGRVGQHFDRLFDERGFDRSNAAGNLMQTLMLFAHRLPCGWGASFHEKCRWAMAYWMAAESYGKAGEKDYSQEKDGYSLIAQIAHGDRLDNGKSWTCPFWAKSGAPTTTAPEPAEPAALPATPAHRPSNQPRRLARLRKALEAIEPDDFGRRVYHNDDLVERLKTPRRTLQADIAKLVADGEIVTAQIAGNGAPYAVLTCHFGGARSTAKADKPTAQLDIFGGASEIAIDGAGMPQTDDRNAVCNKEEDHQKSSAPAGQPPAPAGARPVGAQGFGAPLPPAPAGARAPLEELVYRDAAAMAECWKDMPGVAALPGVPEPAPAASALGTFTFGTLGWRASVRTRQRRKAGPVKQERFTGRDQQALSSKYANKKRYGKAPAPTPVRVAAPLPPMTLATAPIRVGIPIHKPNVNQRRALAVLDTFDDMVPDAAPD